MSNNKSLKDSLSRYCQNKEKKIEEDDKIIESDYAIYEFKILSLLIKINLLLEYKNLNPELLEEIHTTLINLISDNYNDDTVTKDYLISEVDRLIKDNKNSSPASMLDSIKKEIDNMSLQEVEELSETINDCFEEYEENYIIKFLYQYISYRKYNIQNNNGIISNQEQTFTKKHPKIVGFGRFIKNASLTLMGESLKMSDKDIERLKNNNIVGVISSLQSTTKKRNSELTKKKKEYQMSLEAEYKKAFEERGLDYNIIMGKSAYISKKDYLERKKISAIDYQVIRAEIIAEVNEAMREKKF